MNKKLAKLNFKKLRKFELYLCFLLLPTMNNDLQQIQGAAQGLFFLSESEHPFEIVQLEKAGSIENQLSGLANKPAGTAMEKTTLDLSVIHLSK